MLVQISHYTEVLNAEQKSNQILNKIYYRLEKEIMDLQVESHDLTDKNEKLAQDLKFAVINLRNIKHEYNEKNKQLETLRKTVKNREMTRLAKMSQLKSIVIEGENSVAKLQQSIFNSSQVSYGYNATKTKSSTPRNVASRQRAKSEERASRQTTREAHVKLIDHIQEMKVRYETKDMRAEKLVASINELHDTKEKLKFKKQELESNLAKAKDRLERLASTRQVYKVIEEKDNVLHAARKECEEWSERDQRLSQNIETLKRTLPRLLTKLTHNFHPMPNVEQVPDAIHKLDDELGKLIKQTSSLLMKEATPEDIALASQQSLQNGSPPPSLPPPIT